MLTIAHIPTAVLRGGMRVCASRQHMWTEIPLSAPMCTCGRKHPVETPLNVNFTLHHERRCRRNRSILLWGKLLDYAAQHLACCYTLRGARMW